MQQQDSILNRPSRLIQRCFGQCTHTGTHPRHYLAAAKLCLNGINSTIASASPRGRTSAGVKRVFFPSSMTSCDHTSGYSAIHCRIHTRVSLDPRGQHLHEAALHLIVECGEQIPNPLLCFRGIIRTPTQRICWVCLPQSIPDLKIEWAQCKGPPNLPTVQMLGCHKVAEVIMV